MNTFRTCNQKMLLLFIGPSQCGVKSTFLRTGWDCPGRAGSCHHLCSAFSTHCPTAVPRQPAQRHRRATHAQPHTLSPFPQLLPPSHAASPPATVPPVPGCSPRPWAQRAGTAVTLMPSVAITRPNRLEARDMLPAFDIISCFLLL